MNKNRQTTPIILKKIFKLFQDLRLLLLESKSDFNINITKKSATEILCDEPHGEK